MAEVKSVIKLQVPASKATPAPPIGPALGQHGLPIQKFCQEFNERTQKAEAGTLLPVQITVLSDRTFTFVINQPPASILIKKALQIEKGSGEPNTKKVGTLSKDQLMQIAETKMPDLNTQNIQAAMKIIAGTARSMGVEVDCPLDETTG